MTHEKNGNERTREQERGGIDVIVIGAGPIGLFSVFMCGMMGLRCVVVEALSEVGGQCAALYPDKPIVNVPGFSSILAKDLVDKLMEQIKPFSPEIHTSERVISLTPSHEIESGWDVTTRSGLTLSGKAVIVATGAGAFAPKRLDVPNVGAFEGKSLFYSVRDKGAFEGKRVLLAGGGDPVVDWALAFSEKSEVVIVHRREQFRAHPGSLQLLKQKVEEGKIRMYAPAAIVELHGDEAQGKLEHVCLKSDDGTLTSIAIDEMLVFYGMVTDTSTVKSWGFEVERNKISVDPSTGQTNHPLVYAVGDAVTYTKKIGLILPGFAEATQAAYHIRSVLWPQESYWFQQHPTIPGKHCSSSCGS